MEKIKISKKEFEEQFDITDSHTPSIPVETDDNFENRTQEYDAMEDNLEW